jgi:hypothetical protein
MSIFGGPRFVVAAESRVGRADAKPTILLGSVFNSLIPPLHAHARLADEKPSPSMGEGWGEGETHNNRLLRQVPRAVLDGLGQVLRLYRAGAIEIGDRPRHLQDAVEPPS